MAFHSGMRAEGSSVLLGDGVVVSASLVSSVLLFLLTGLNIVTGILSVCFIRPRSPKLTAVGEIVVT